MGRISSGVVGVVLYEIGAELLSELFERVQAQAVAIGSGNAWRELDLHQAFRPELRQVVLEDRKSTRLNSSHAKISNAVFGLKKSLTIPTLLQAPRFGPQPLLE